MMGSRAAGNDGSVRECWPLRPHRTGLVTPLRLHVTNRPASLSARAKSTSTTGLDLHAVSQVHSPIACTEPQLLFARTVWAFVFHERVHCATSLKPLLARMHRPFAGPIYCTLTYSIPSEDQVVLSGQWEEQAIGHR